ncbi:MAG: hypothetical protein PHH00_02190 [Candidatus Nanoarchaeia archaeon]|nr:hypothetical protein [Candidatus Nanoarchaeia archaeon]
MYWRIQKEILSEINKKGPNNSENKDTAQIFLFSQIVKQRIYDLNREFILLVNGEFYNSILALTRQMNEIFIILINCRVNKSLIDNLLKKEKLDLRIRDAIDNLKGKIKFPYLKDFNETKFLESIQEDFNLFSNLIHLSGLSLSQNMWIFNKEKNETRLYVEDPELKEGELLAVFSKKSVVSDKQYQYLIHQFYILSSLCLTELKLLEEKR